MAARLSRCLLCKDGLLQPARWATKRRFLGYPEEHEYRCEAPAITEEQKREKGMVD